MATRLILQSPLNPTEMLASLEALAGRATSELRIAVAYATKTGCDELLPRLLERIGADRWREIAKVAVISTDFHITEPAALVDLQAHGFAVHLSNTPSSNFHPKLYAFGSDPKVRAMVGSANLTRAALTVNTEAAVVSDLSRGFASTWAELVGASIPLTDQVLDRYIKERRKAPPKIRPDRTVRAKRPRAAAVVFSDAVLAGSINPLAFDALWVEAGSMSSSDSHAQLEMPRRSGRFFGFNFNSYDKQHHLVGIPKLFSGGSEWDDRPLTWHGKNSMERMNLPTIALGGFEYPNTAVLFKREQKRGFQIVVAPWASATANAWRAASSRSGRVYKLGGRSPRICGLF
jgi:hypothetical protein